MAHASSGDEIAVFCFTEQVSDDERLSEISWKLEEIFSKSVFQCGYRQNPFNVRSPRPGHSNDTIQEVMETTQSGVTFPGMKVTRRVPHGLGKLSTARGKVIYEGKWHKGEQKHLQFINRPLLSGHLSNSRKAL